MTNSVKRVALAYSGGLDTSIIIPWLKENYNCEVVAIAADVGQGEELAGLKEKAIATGASEIYIEDLRHEFVTEYIWPTLRAGAVYERSAEQVFVFVDCAGAQRGPDVFSDEFVAQVFDVDFSRASGDGLFLQSGQLFALPDVGGDRDYFA